MLASHITFLVFLKWFQPNTAFVESKRSVLPPNTLKFVLYYHSETCRAYITTFTTAISMEHISNVLSHHLLTTNSKIKELNYLTLNSSIHYAGYVSHCDVMLKRRLFMSLRLLSDS